MKWGRKPNGRELSTKLESFTKYIKELFGDKYYWIPNAGAWITLRDPTDYSLADGVMIEGFSMRRESAFSSGGLEASDEQDP